MQGDQMNLQRDGMDHRAVTDLGTRSARTGLRQLMRCYTCIYSILIILLISA